MQEINIGGTKMLAALEWDAIAGIRKSQEIKESAKKAGKNYAVVVDGAEAVGVGFASKPSKLPAAAAWLAQAYETKNTDFILVEPLEDGRYWVCAIRKGVPVLGYDIVVDFDGAVSRVTDLVSFGGFVVFSRDQVLAQTFGGVPEILIEDFASLTKGKTCKNKIKKVAGVPVLPIVLGVLFFGGIAGWMAYESYEEERLLEERRQAALHKKDAAAAAVIANNQEAIRKWRLDYEKAKTSEIDKVLKAMSRDDSQMVSVWYKSLTNRRVDVPGWDIQSANCSYAQCLYIYDSGRAGGTNSALVTAVGQSGKVIFKGESFGRAKLSIDLPKVPEVQMSQMDIPTEDEFYARVVSEIQSLSSFGVKIDINSIADITFTPPPAPKVEGNVNEILPKDVLAPNKQTGLMKGTLVIRGEGVFPLVALSKAMEVGKGIVLSELRTPIDLMAPQQWKIEGLFYIKKGN